MFEQPAYHWADPQWRAAAESWIHERVWERDGRVTGAITGVRFLPWSAVLRAPTISGASGAANVYFKACGPSQAHEPALAALLYRARPDCMIPVLAADAARGWLLTADGGATLTAAHDTGGDEVAHWSRVLALQAEVQRELMPRAAELLATGVPDRRPSVLPGLYEALLARPNRLLVGEPGAMTTADVGHLRAAASRLSELCAELAALGPPDTFIHDDFHEDHFFARRNETGDWRYTFFDFGDACIGHPFMQLICQPRFAGNRFGLRPDSVQISLCEFYLSCWRDYAPKETLIRAMSLAHLAGCVIRALTWVNACDGHLDVLPADLRDAYGSRVAFWLMQIPRRIEILDDNAQTLPR